jgi:iron complex transport system ATP-binding protein
MVSHPAVNLEGVTASYPGGPDVISELTLSIEPGEFTALLGPNGSGKTTLIRLADGLLAPSRGRVSIDGAPVDGLARRELARRVAVVHQEEPARFAFSVEEAVAMGRWARDGGGFLGTVGIPAVESAMRLADVSHLRRRPVTALSGGERRRVQVARALAQETGILLLDEPAAHLDPRHRMDLMELLARINRERRITVLLTLHELDLAFRFCRRVVVLHRGRVAADGDPDRVAADPVTAGVFGLEMRLDPNPHDGTRRLTVFRATET